MSVCPCGGSVNANAGPLSPVDFSSFSAALSLPVSFFSPHGYDMTKYMKTHCDGVGMQTSNGPALFLSHYLILRNHQHKKFLSAPFPAPDGGRRRLKEGRGVRLETKRTKGAFTIPF
jgi:hypothetical protein